MHRRLCGHFGFNDTVNCFLGFLFLALGGARIRHKFGLLLLESLSSEPELIDLDTRTKLPLLSLARAGRPLVLNFGSCT